MNRAISLDCEISSSRTFSSTSTIRGKFFTKCLSFLKGKWETAERVCDLWYFYFLLSKTFLLFPQCTRHYSSVTLHCFKPLLCLGITPLKDCLLMFLLLWGSFSCSQYSGLPLEFSVCFHNVLLSVGCFLNCHLLILCPPCNF